MRLADLRHRVESLRGDLAGIERDLARQLEGDRGRGRAEVNRLIHEIRRMRLGEAYPFTSQAGQDVVVDRLFKGKRGGTFADIGGYDGVSGSNTLYLEARKGWTGVLVEPVTAQREKAAQVRRCPCLPYAVAAQDGTATMIEVREGFTQMSGLEGSYDAAMLARVRSDPRHSEAVVEVETRTLSRILTEAGVPDPDFLSLDIEGGELDVLSAFPFDRHRVGVWSIENNTADARIGEVMRGAGYRLVEFCGPDEMWLHSDLSS